MSYTPRDWHAQLKRMDPTLRALLVPWLHRLRSLVTRAFIDSPQARRGTPDGYEGITTRGLPDRLLASEWVLADAAPDLFLLRAASNEQLHHQLARREPTERPSIVLVVDTGPSQAGSPLLVPLAIALLLLRERAGDVFWCHPGEPEARHALALDDPETWQGLLALRTGAPVPHDAWQACVEGVDGSRTVCIGQPPEGVGHAQIWVEESTTDALIEVRVGSARAHLPRPAPPRAARALRGFRAFEPSDPSTVGSFRLEVARARRLAVSLWHAGEVRRFTGKSGYAHVTRPTPGWRIEGVCRRGRRLFVLQRSEDRISVGNPFLAQSDPSHAWVGLPSAEPIHGCWRLKVGLVVHIGSQLWMLRDAHRRVEHIGTVEPGGVLQTHTHQLMVLPERGTDERRMRTVDDHGRMAPRYSSPPMDAYDRVLPTWGGQPRVVGRSVHAPTGYSSRSRPEEVLPPGVPLQFWQHPVYKTGIAPVLWDEKTGQLRVGSEVLSAPPVLSVAPHPWQNDLIAISRDLQLVRIGLSHSRYGALTVHTRIDVLVERL